MTKQPINLAAIKADIEHLPAMGFGQSLSPVGVDVLLALVTVAEAARAETQNRLAAGQEITKRLNDALAKFSFDGVE